MDRYFIRLNNNSYTTIALFVITNARINKIQTKYFLANNPKFLDGGNDDIKHHLLLPSTHFEKIIRYLYISIISEMYNSSIAHIFVNYQITI